MTYKLSLFRGNGEALPLDTYRQCNYITHTSHLAREPPVPLRKTQTMSLRVSPEFKSALKLAAERERRSQTNLLEHLLFAYCEQNGIPVKSHSPKKKTKS